MTRAPSWNHLLRQSRNTKCDPNANGQPAPRSHSPPIPPPHPYIGTSRVFYAWNSLPKHIVSFLIASPNGNLACTSGQFHHGTEPKAFGVQHLTTKSPHWNLIKACALISFGLAWWSQPKKTKTSNKIPHDGFWGRHGWHKKSLLPRKQVIVKPKTASQHPSLLGNYGARSTRPDVAIRVEHLQDMDSSHIVI